ncbi:MAG: hypothetical protein AABY32_01700 [Nanoarchaeota archaeon]
MENYQNETLSMLRSPDKWPHFYFLPVKNTIKKDTFGPLCGIVRPNKFIVYIVNIFNEESMKNIKNAQKFEYISFEAIVEDGWIVD